MSRRPLPFIGPLFKQPDTSLSPFNITSFSETVPEGEPEVSPESEAILRRGNWDYMWRRVRDLAAQDDPGFSPDVEFDDDGSQAR